MSSRAQKKARRRSFEAVNSWGPAWGETPGVGMRVDYAALEHRTLAATRFDFATTGRTTSSRPNLSNLRPEDIMPRARDTRMGQSFVLAPDKTKGHQREVPFDLPTDLEAIGPCVCVECKRHAGAAYHELVDLTSKAIIDSEIVQVKGGKLRRYVRTEEWRRLSWCLGDAAADWVCGWADTRPNTRVVLDACLTVAELEISDRDEHPRQKVYRFIRGQM